MNLESSGILEVKNLCFSYRGGFELSLARLTFAGGVCCLLGPNGAGKSTFIRLLTTSVMIPRGVIFFEGRDVRDDLRSYRRQLGYLPQRFGMVNNYRVSEMLEYVSWMKGVPKKARSEAIERAAQQCDVTRFLTHRISALSGGTLRRVGIAQAIVNSPKILILDEPTAGLDMVQQSQLYSVVKSLSRESVILVATHSSSDVAEMSSQLVILNEGSTVYSGAVDDLSTHGGASRREGIEIGYRAVVAAKPDVSL